MQLFIPSCEGVSLTVIFLVLCSWAHDIFTLRFCLHWFGLDSHISVISEWSFLVFLCLFFLFSLFTYLSSKSLWVCFWNCYIYYNQQQQFKHWHYVYLMFTSNSMGETSASGMPRQEKQFCTSPPRWVTQRLLSTCWASVGSPILFRHLGDPLVNCWTSTPQTPGTAPLYKWLLKKVSDAAAAVSALV